MNEQLIDLITQLTIALERQTAAINALVESNARLIMVIAEGATDEDIPFSTYLDGSCR